MFGHMGHWKFSGTSGLLWITFWEPLYFYLQTEMKALIFVCISTTTCVRFSGYWIISVRKGPGRTQVMFRKMESENVWKVKGTQGRLIRGPKQSAATKLLPATLWGGRGQDTLPARKVHLGSLWTTIWTIRKAAELLWMCVQKRGPFLFAHRMEGTSSSP